MDIGALLGQLGIDWQLFLFNVFNTLIIVYILKRFFFKKIIDTLEQREAEIQSGYQAKQEGELMKDQAIQEKESLIIDARKKASQIISEAEQQALLGKNRILAEADIEAEAIKTQGQQAIAQERSRMRMEIAKETKELVLETARKISKRTKVIDSSEIDQLLYPKQ